MDNFDKEEKREYTTKIIAYYESKLNDPTRNNSEINDKVRNIQEKFNERNESIYS